ncbi:hypothetical protein PIB30_076828, partial [Stylosanthes scabra]|nr:hypothetical protein [Stylosanthes scabra]
GVLNQIRNDLFQHRCESIRAMNRGSTMLKTTHPNRIGTEFIGVYYSEELKYAKKLGYRVIPLSGYLFDRKGTPFRDFVSNLYESRLNAKK